MDKEANSEAGPVKRHPQTIVMDNPAFQLDANETTTDVPMEPALRSSENGVMMAEADEGYTMEMLYGVDDVPPWYMCILLGLQHYLTMVGSTITIPFILTPLMCIDDSDPARGKIVSTIFFVSGLVTLLQSSLGVRLPIVQGGTFSFLVPTIAILSTAFESCDNIPLLNMTMTEREEVWQVRMREIQGAIVLSSLFQVIVGFTVHSVVVTWVEGVCIVFLPRQLSIADVFACWLQFG